MACPSPCRSEDSVALPPLPLSFVADVISRVAAVQRAAAAGDGATVDSGRTDGRTDADGRTDSSDVTGSGTVAVAAGSLPRRPHVPHSESN